MQGPVIENTKLDQIAALPLGGRVKVNPWDNTAEMVKTAPVAITSARDKMPFEVTPFFPRLSRYRCQCHCSRGAHQRSEQQRNN